MNDVWYINMRMINRHTLCVLTFVSTSFPLQASESDFQQYWYVGGGVGIGDYGDVKNKDAYDSATTRFAGDAHLGFAINKYLSSELSYQYLGSAYAKYPQGEIDGEFQQLVLSAKVGYPLDSAFYPYARVGGAAWFGESRGLREADEQGFAPVIGAGIEYAFSSSLVARLDYQYTDSLGDESVGYTNHHLMTIGFDWRFGFIQEQTESVAVMPMPIEEVEIKETKTFVYSEQKNHHLFAFDSSQLINTAAFSDVLAFLKQHPEGSVVIEGHTDNVGSEEYNQRLSEERANAVKSFFISSGINQTRITTSGKGEKEPVASNNIPEGRAMNRRIEMTIPEVVISARNAASE